MAAKDGMFLLRADLQKLNQVLFTVPQIERFELVGQRSFWVFTNHFARIKFIGKLSSDF